MTDRDPAVRAEGLVKAWDGGRVRALDGVSLRVERGEMLGVVGPSGSGKSTLLHLLGALDRPDAGRVVLDGVDLSRERELDAVRARRVGFVFQLHNLLPALTALENVTVPLRALRIPRREREERARRLLEAVGLGERLGHLPARLSGGERQRVAVARAVVNDPAVVLADEPTGDLDQETGRRVLDLLEGIRRGRELSVVLVTHDPAVAARADRVVRLVDGRIAEPG